MKPTAVSRTHPSGAHGDREDLLANLEPDLFRVNGFGRKSTAPLFIACTLIGTVA